MLIGAVLDSHHWTLMVIYPLQKKAVYLNSIGEKEHQMKNCENVTRMFLRRKEINVSKIQCTTLSHPNQQDGVSCGVFVCKVACDMCNYWFHCLCIEETQRPNNKDSEFICYRCKNIK
ncbi:uncharacterized protein LOC128666751 isoform X2 [Bombina bombina]|nr:uncharacterized protein LOC128666751 isoform X2 [Bombina bombina]